MAINAFEGEYLKEEFNPSLELTWINNEDNLPMCKSERQDWHPNLILFKSNKYVITR